MEVGDGIVVGEGDSVCVGAMVAEDLVLTGIELLVGIGVLGWEASGTAAGEAQPAIRVVIKPSNRQVFFMNIPIPLMNYQSDYKYHTFVPPLIRIFVSGMSKKKPLP